KQISTFTTAKEKGSIKRFLDKSRKSLGQITHLPIFLPLRTPSFGQIAHEKMAIHTLSAPYESK
ncbi:hypothetical protein, partial [Porphyromonas loveana]|uniref:hypothetical protein n=1 Tax=Porphyromonas loveana TaxID=1884669 RepID=UPI00359F2496